MSAVLQSRDAERADFFGILFVGGGGGGGGGSFLLFVLRTLL